MALLAIGIAAGIGAYIGSKAGEALSNFAFDFVTQYTGEPELLPEFLANGIENWLVDNDQYHNFMIGSIAGVYFQNNPDSSLEDLADYLIGQAKLDPELIKKENLPLLTEAIINALTDGYLVYYGSGERYIYPKIWRRQYNMQLKL